MSGGSALADRDTQQCSRRRLLGTLDSACSRGSVPWSERMHAPARIESPQAHPGRVAQRRTSPPQVVRRNMLQAQSACSVFRQTENGLLVVCLRSSITVSPCHEDQATAKQRGCVRRAGHSQASGRRKCAIRRIE